RCTGSSSPRSTTGVLVGPEAGAPVASSSGASAGAATDGRARATSRPNTIRGARRRWAMQSSPGGNGGRDYTHDLFARGVGGGGRRCAIERTSEIVAARRGRGRARQGGEPRRAAALGGHRRRDVDGPGRQSRGQRDGPGPGAG